jgi:hypothetical protein
MWLVEMLYGEDKSEEMRKGGKERKMKGGKSKFWS